MIHQRWSSTYLKAKRNPGMSAINYRALDALTHRIKTDFTLHFEKGDAECIEFNEGSNDKSFYIETDGIFFNSISNKSLKGL